MKKFKVGDRIVQGGRVYRIFKVRKRKSREGEEERIIYFKPHFKNKMDNGLICSVPAKSIKDTDIRKPANKKELKEITDKLAEKTNKNGKIDLSELKEELTENVPKKTAKVLKAVWRDKNNENTSFSPSKKKVFRSALRSISEELAYANKINLDTAKKRVEKYLTKAIS